MSRCIAFLRAVNVGGRTVKMAALREAFEALGFSGVETFLASGNVIFETRARDLAALERKIETHLNTAFGFEIHSFIRGADCEPPGLRRCSGGRGEHLRRRLSRRRARR